MEKHLSKVVIQGIKTTGIVLVAFVGVGGTGIAMKTKGREEGRVEIVAEIVNWAGGDIVINDNNTAMENARIISNELKERKSELDALQENYDLLVESSSDLTEILNGKKQLEEDLHTEEKKNEELSKENEELLKENEELSKENEELSKENEELLKKLQEKESGTDLNNEPISIEETQKVESEEIVLKPHGWSNQERYKIYPEEDRSGFIMYGETYLNGFTINIGASDLFHTEEEYAIYNIEKISNNYSTLKFLVGHIDGYINSTMVVRIFLDKAMGDKPDYEYTIYPELSPQEISIDISGKVGMVIKVSNNGRSGNAIGFANPTFE